MRECRRGGLKTVAYKWQRISKYDPCPRLLEINVQMWHKTWCTWKLHTLFGLKVSSCGSNPCVRTMQNTAGNVKLALAALAAHMEESWAQKGGEFGKSAKSPISTGIKHQLPLWKWISKPTSIIRGNPPFPENTPNSLWPQCYQLTVDNSWCVGSPLSCGGSEPISGHLSELSGKWRSWIGKMGWLQMKSEPEALAGISTHYSQRLAREFNAVMIFYKFERTDALWTPRKIPLLNSYLPALGSVSVLEDQTSCLLPTN